MLEVIKMVSPSPEQFGAVFHGMRHAFKSYDRSDSFFCKKSFVSHENGTLETYVKGEFILGANDKNLAINLVKAGNPSHRKFLRQLPIILEIKAPEYWWRQMDAYKIGVVMNSTSQMHNLISKPFELSDFSIDIDATNPEESAWAEHALGNIINQLNEYRDEYLNYSDNEWEKNTNWRGILFVVPQSYNYTRTVSMNYEVALQIIEQRMNHKLPEWTTLINELLELPYMREFAEAAGVLND